MTWYDASMRRGQSSLEPMLVLTVVVLGVLAWAGLQPERAYGVLVGCVNWLETQPIFQTWLAWMEGR